MSPTIAHHKSPTSSIFYYKKQSIGDFLKILDRGFAGPSSLLYGESYWPVTGCTRHANCWASAVAKEEGWEEYDVKFLMCDIETGTCMCKTGYMDADDDRYNGCETKVLFELLPLI